MNDENKNKTNAELLKEVKKLREETKKDNKKKWNNSTYNAMLIIGILLLAIYFFVKCSF